MTTSAEPPPGGNVYFVDPESVAEMGRLLDMDRVFTEGMGGLFPELSESEIAGLHRVLDVACGPGGWVQEVAFTYPDIEVIGIDISQAMIDYANMQASVQGLNNAHFRVMDMQQPLDFPEQSFDLFNARFINFLPAAGWRALMREAARVTRPGGIIRLTESEWWYFTNSPALERFNLMVMHFIKKLGGFSESGMFTGILPMLGRLMLDVGCLDIRHKAHVIDFSAGTPVHENFRRSTAITFKLFQPRIVRMGIATQQELDQTYDQMVVEMMQDSFRGVIFLLTAWGKKPVDLSS
jgi:ubiquinone/menaquinone biosynthesis C-methylase UbiE